MMLNDHFLARARRARARASAVVMTAVLGGSVLATLPVLGATASVLADAPSAVVSPGTVCSGSTVTLTVSVPAGLGQVVSVGVASTQFTITDPSNTSVGIAVVDGSGRLVWSGLNLSGGQTASVTFKASTVSSASGTWDVYFEGDGSDGPFDDPTGPDDALVPVAATVAAGCHLVFTAQPADAGKNKTITSVNLNDAGAPIALEVRDSGNVLVPVAANVSLGLLLNGASTSGILTPGTPVVGPGTITLGPSVSAPTATKAYTLQVTPTDSAIARATSSAFQIWDAAQACAVDCTLTTGGTANTFTVTANPQAGAGLGATLNAVNLDCSPLKFGGFSPIPGTQTFGWTYTGGGFKTETILVGKSLLTTRLLLAKALIYQVCYSAPVQFTTYFGLKAQPDPTVSAAMGQQFYTGLLRPCFSSDPTSALAQSRAPCVLDRQWTSAGEVVKVLSNPGDPYSR
jgi:hypothetical protein